VAAGVDATSNEERWDHALDRLLSVSDGARAPLRDRRRLRDGARRVRLGRNRAGRGRPRRLDRVERDEATPNVPRGANAAQVAFDRLRTKVLVAGVDVVNDELHVLEWDATQ